MSVALLSVAKKSRHRYHPSRIFQKMWIKILLLAIFEQPNSNFREGQKVLLPILTKGFFVTVTFFQEDFLLRTSQVYQGQRPSLVHDLTYNKKTKKVNQTIDSEMSDNQN
jgi:hypothetical protein